MPVPHRCCRQRLCKVDIASKENVPASLPREVARPVPPLTNCLSVVVYFNKEIEASRRKGSAAFASTASRHLTVSLRRVARPVPAAEIFLNTPSRPSIYPTACPSVALPPPLGFQTPSPSSRTPSNTCRQAQNDHSSKESVFYNKEKLERARITPPSPIQ